MKRALVSVSNKEGIEEFCRGLVALGIEIVSTGGTAKRLTDSGIPVCTVEEFTGFPEMMDGRVKSLHPKVHGAILADRDNPTHREAVEDHGIKLIDLVVVNLYPFAEVAGREHATQQDLIENIDVGGPALIRSAAKNYYHVGVVVDPNDYVTVIDELKRNKQLSLETHYYLMQKAFAHTAAYDAMIAHHMNRTRVFTDELTFGYSKVDNLRYGENPHQRAAYYKEPLFHSTSITKADVLQGKELSYNNIMDADAALRLLLEFEQPAATIMKHTNPCGTATADDIKTAFTRAYEADRLSAFGGIIGLNRPCTKEIAEHLAETFVEVVLAPDFEEDALNIFSTKPKVRLLRLGAFTAPKQHWETRTLLGGALVQESNTHVLTAADLKVVTLEKPTEDQVRDLLFAWKVCKHVKSNAIVLAKNGVTIGVGAGQMSRIDSVEIALWKAQGENQELTRIESAVAASDAFFPFRDSVDTLAAAGISAIIQPGGSLKDMEVIEAANQHHLAMVTTGIRAFLH